MKIHLGCGQDYKEGYVNVDFTDDVKVDKIMDLEEELPLEDNSVEEVIANHVFEHIENFIELMHELHRVCKSGAIIKIKTPFYSAWGQYNDPTHVRFFTPYTFNYFKKGEYSHEVGCYEDMFDVKKVQINFGIGSSSKLNPIINPIVNFNHKFYCRFLAWIFPCAEIEYELEVLKTSTAEITSNLNNTQSHGDKNNE